MLHNCSCLINYCYDIVYICSCQEKTVNLKIFLPERVPKSRSIDGQQASIDQHQVGFTYAYSPDQIQQAADVAQIDVHGIDAKAGA